MSVTENHLLHGNLTIIAISVVGSKTKGFSPYIQIRNKRGIYFSINIEDCGVAEQKLQQRLGTNSLTDSTLNILLKIDGIVVLCSR